MAASIAAALTRPLTLDDGAVILPRASVGVAVHPDHGDTPADPLRWADPAMYTAKAGAYAAATPAAGQVIAAASPLSAIRGPRPATP